MTIEPLPGHGVSTARARTMRTPPPLEVLRYDDGPEPAYVVVYALGTGYAFENRARQHGMVAISQPEASLRPMRAGELVPLANPNEGGTL